MALETTLTLSNLVIDFYEKTFLENLKQALVFYEFTEKYPVPKGFGPTVKFARLAPFAGDTTPLSEGQVPVEKQLTDERVTATAYQYGNFIKVSDWVLATNIAGYNPFIEKAVKEISFMAQDTIDLLVRNAFGEAAGANVKLANGAATYSALVGNTDVMTAGDLRKIVRDLKKRKVPTYDNQFYIGIIGAGQVYDLQSDSGSDGWVDAVKYDRSALIDKGEIGRFWGARIIESLNLSTDSQSGTISECYFFGRDAVGVTDITEVSKGDRVDMKHINIYIKGLGSAGTADPLDQIATVGYKFNLGTKRLDDKRVTIYKAGETA